MILSRRELFFIYRRNGMWKEDWKRIRVASLLAVAQFHARQGLSELERYNLTNFACKTSHFRSRLCSCKIVKSSVAKNKSFALRAVCCVFVFHISFPLPWTWSEMFAIISRRIRCGNGKRPLKIFGHRARDVGKQKQSNKPYQSSTRSGYVFERIIRLLCVFDISRIARVVNKRLQK